MAVPPLPATQNAFGTAVSERRNPLVTFGENKFSDLCFDEFARDYLGTAKTTPRRRPKTLQPDAERAAMEILEALPEVDWRTSDAVGPIKDQARCGSCWAFGTVANIESQYYLWATDGKNGTYISLSEQELVSCDHFKDNTGSDQGCNGGLMDTWRPPWFLFVEGSHGGLMDVTRTPGWCRRRAVPS